MAGIARNGWLGSPPQGWPGWWGYDWREVARQG
jgi:hypothetical protein